MSTTLDRKTTESFRTRASACAVLAFVWIGAALADTLPQPLPIFPLVSTTIENGELNPYGVAFVPAGFPEGGSLGTGDLLVSNFNNSANVQGTGSTIVKVTNGNTSLFFAGTPGL